MKNLILLFLLFFSISVSAQATKKNALKTGIYHVFDKNGYNLRMYNFSYQRDIGLGLSVLFQFNKAQGGKKLNSIIKKSDIVYLDYYHILGYGDQNFENTYGEFIQFRNYGLGLNKEVKLSNSIFMNFSLSGIYTDISKTKIANVKHDSEGKLLIDEFYSTFSTTNLWGVHSALGMDYQIKKYLRIGATIAYFTKPQFFIIGINTSVLF